MRTAIFAVFFLANVAWGQNLVPNGEFDTQLPPWNGSSPSWTAAWNSTDLTGNPASGSARIQWLSSGVNPIVAGGQTINTSFPFSAVGQAYVLGARFRVLANTPDRPIQALSVGIDFEDSLGNSLGNGTATTCPAITSCQALTPGDYQVSNAVVAPPGTVSVLVSIFVPPTPGFTVLVDDVHLVQQTVAPTFSPRGLAMLALLLVAVGAWRIIRQN